MPQRGDWSQQEAWVSQSGISSSRIYSRPLAGGIAGLVGNPGGLHASLSHHDHESLISIATLQKS